MKWGAEEKAKFIGTAIYRRWQHKELAVKLGLKRSEQNIDWDARTHMTCTTHTPASWAWPLIRGNAKPPNNKILHTWNWNRKHELVISARCIICFSFSGRFALYFHFSFFLLVARIVAFHFAVCVHSVKIANYFQFISRFQPTSVRVGRRRHRRRWSFRQVRFKIY